MSSTDSISTTNETTMNNNEFNISDFALIPITKVSNELFNFNSYNKKLEAFTNDVSDQVYNLEQISPALVKKIILETLYKTYVEEKPRKPQAPSSYILYFNANYHDFVAKNPLIKPNMVARSLGQQWKALSEEEQAPYKQRVEEIKSQIADGTYNPPMKSRNNKRRRTSTATVDATVDANESDVNTCIETDVEETVAAPVNNVASVKATKSSKK
jgi:hypothetical protein